MSKLESLPLSELKPYQLSQAQIRDYLLTEPEFFAQNPDLITRLRIPHPQRGVTSLLERQLLHLREKVSQQEEELNALLATASRNETIYRFYGQLIFDLLNCHSIEQLRRELYQRLRQQFNFEQVRLHVASQEQAFESIRAILRRRLNADNYYLGRLPAAEAQQLVEIETGSVVLMGLGDYGNWQGVLAIASQNPSHFMADMDTLLLDQLKYLLSHQLRSLLSQPQYGPQPERECSKPSSNFVAT